MLLVPLILILRKKKKPLPQPRNAAHAVQPVLARRRPYDAAMARSEALYYRAHNDLITETPPWPVDREGRPLARIKKQPTFHFCGLTGSDASCCQCCFFIFCCPFAMLAACNGSM